MGFAPVVHKSFDGYEIDTLLLERNKQDSLLKLIVIYDEKWISYTSVKNVESFFFFFSSYNLSFQNFVINLKLSLQIYQS